MTTDALNFRELAFRQTSSRRPPRPPAPRSLQSPASHLHRLAPSRGSQGPQRAPTRVEAAREPPPVRPLQPGQTSGGRLAIPPSPPRAAAPPPRPQHGPSGSKLRARRPEARTGAGPLPARAPGARDAALLASRPRRPRRCRPARTGTRGRRCLTFRSLPLALAAPRPRAGVPGPPRPPRPPDGSGGRSSGAARRGRNFAPGRPRLAAPAGGRQKLRRRRRPRGQGRGSARLASRGPRGPRGPRAPRRACRRRRTLAGPRAAPPPPGPACPCPLPPPGWPAALGTERSPRMESSEALPLSPTPPARLTPFPRRMTGQGGRGGAGSSRGRSHSRLCDSENLGEDRPPPPAPPGTKSPPLGSSPALCVAATTKR
ncbi:unnamed protein product [Nyctereutes procyonoides]|uniref:(raccoon dog) hypothetical protein n=1 Tax=Nyctereutes procyonoides TaxID=34880 RepID=A0A811Z018_NYCPR|nr:unnamed protein product [Nyctereutes procyonoides]